MNIVHQTRALENRLAAIAGSIAAGGPVGRAPEFVAAAKRLAIADDLASATLHADRAEQELREARNPPPIPLIPPIRLTLDRALGVPSEPNGFASAELLNAGILAAIREPARVVAEGYAAGVATAEVAFAIRALGPIMPLTAEDERVFPLPTVSPLSAFVTCDSTWAAELAKSIGVETVDLGRRVAAAHAESVQRGEWLRVFWLRRLHSYIAANASNGQPEAVEAVTVTRVLGVWRPADVAASSR